MPPEPKRPSSSGLEKTIFLTFSSSAGVFEVMSKFKYHGINDISYGSGGGDMLEVHSWKHDTSKENTTGIFSSIESVCPCAIGFGTIEHDVWPAVFEY